MEEVSKNCVIEEVKEAAKKNAIEFVHSQLKSQSDLEKLEMLKEKLLNNKAREEARLKSDFTLQLEYINSRMQDVDAAVEDCSVLNKEMAELKKFMEMFQKMRPGMAEVVRYSLEFSCISKSIQLLDKLFNMPETVEQSKKLLNSDGILSAHKNILDMEHIRDELYWQHCQVISKQYNSDNRAANEALNSLNKYFADLDELNAQLLNIICSTMKHSLELSKTEAVTVSSAVRVILREEYLDEYWNRKLELLGPSASLITHRPKSFKQKAFAAIQKNIYERLSVIESEWDSSNPSSVTLFLEKVRQMMDKDMKIVRNNLVRCFPPNMNLPNEYFKIYHTEVSDSVECLSKHVIEKCESPQDDFGSCNLACISLLMWENNYFRPGGLISTCIVDPPSVEYFLQNLSLISKELHSQLEESFLLCTSKIQEQFVSRLVVNEFERWCSEQEPELIDLPGGIKQINIDLTVLVFRIITPNLKDSIKISQKIQYEMTFTCISSLQNLALKLTKQYENYLKVQMEYHELLHLSPEALTNTLISSSSGTDQSSNSSMLALSGLMGGKSSSHNSCKQPLQDLMSSGTIVSIPQIIAKIPIDFAGWPHFMEYTIDLANNTVGMVEHMEKLKDIIKLNSMPEFQLKKYQQQTANVQSQFQKLGNICCEAMCRDFSKEIAPAFHKLFSKQWQSNPSGWMRGLMNALSGFHQITQLINSSLRLEVLKMLDRSLSHLFIKCLFQQKFKFASDQERKTVFDQFSSNVNELVQWFEQCRNVPGPEHVYCHALSCCISVCSIQVSSFAQPDLNKIGALYPDFTSNHATQLLSVRTDVQPNAMKDMISDLESYVKSTEPKFRLPGIFSEISDRPDSGTFSSILSKAFKK